MLKNLIHTLRRYLTSSVLNILGLSLAMAAFMTIVSQVWFEYSFDRFHKKSDRIYTLVFKTGESDSEDSFYLPKNLIDAFGASSPQIENFTLQYRPFLQTFIRVGENATSAGFTEMVDEVYEDYAAIFDLQFTQGSAQVLNQPSKVLLPQSIATKLFGSESSLGKQLIVNDTTFWEVGGVYRDLPLNSQLDNHILIGKQRLADEPWGIWNYYAYVTLKPGTEPRELVENFNRTFDAKAKMDERGAIDLILMSDLYFDSDLYFSGDTDTKKGNRNMTNILLAIGFLILVIAAVNYINFTTSLAPIRLRSINIQKVFGAGNLKLRSMLILEAIALVMLSLLIAYVMVSVISQSAINDEMMSDLNMVFNIRFVAMMFGLAIILGFAIGLYPALYLTKYPPIMAIKGGFTFSRSGRWLRMSLMGFQFVVSTALIVAALFMQMQNSYMRDMDKGLPKQNIAIAKIDGKLKKNSDIFRNKLLESPLIEDVAFCDNDMGISNQTQGWIFDLRGKEVDLKIYIVSWNFPQLMGISMAEGTSFNENDPGKKALIINGVASRKYDIDMSNAAVEKENYTLAGVCKDFNFKSLHYPVEPLGLMANYKNQNFFRYSYLKIVGNPYQAVDFIRSAAKEIDPDYPISIQFYDDGFNRLYQRELRLTRMIVLFSILVIMIALMGVFGLIVFETQYRRREIGLRKVNGATVTDILLIFNQRFMILTGISFLIAIPMAWYFVRWWLADFVYQVPTYWWIFAASLIIVWLVTLITVTSQTWSAARENPIKSIRN